MNINELIEQEAVKHSSSLFAFNIPNITEYCQNIRRDSFKQGAHFALSQFRWRKVEDDDDELTHPPKFKEVYIKTNWGRVTSGILGHSNWTLDFKLGRDEIIAEWMPIPE